MTITTMTTTTTTDVHSHISQSNRDYFSLESPGGHVNAFALRTYNIYISFFEFGYKCSMWLTFTNAMHFSTKYLVVSLSTR